MGNGIIHLEDDVESDALIAYPRLELRGLLWEKGFRCAGKYVRVIIYGQM